MRPLLLDLFCGAGGAGEGYRRAGFDVVGVDREPHAYPCGDFVEGDALAFLDEHGAEFDVIHASPPCQGYTKLGAKDGRHPRLIGPVRSRLQRTGRPYVIENVEDARGELCHPLRLCGSTFGLGVRRHRLFETNWLAMSGGVCRHRAQGEIRAYYGKPGWAAWSPKGANVQSLGRKPLLRGTVEQAAADMGITWMGWDDLREAIPPAYTEHLGWQLLAQLPRALELSQ